MCFVHCHTARPVFCVQQVSVVPADTVVQRIERLMYDAALSILGGAGFRFSLPSRSNANQLYVPEIDRIVLLENNTTRDFNDQAAVRKTTIMTRILQLIHEARPHCSTFSSAECSSPIYLVRKSAAATTALESAEPQ